MAAGLRKWYRSWGHVIEFHSHRSSLVHAVIRQYKYDPRNAAEINRQINAGFLPIIKKTAGFQAYYWLDSGSGTGASISVFNDKAGADASVKAAAEFVRAKLGHLMTGPPQIVEGSVQAHS